MNSDWNIFTKKAVTPLKTNTSPGKWWLENEMCLQHGSFSGDPLVYSLTTWDVSCPSLRMLAGNCDIFSLGKAIPINLHLPLLLVFVGTSQLGGVIEARSADSKRTPPKAVRCWDVFEHEQWDCWTLLSPDVWSMSRITPPKTNMSREKWWSECYFTFQMNLLQVTFVRLFGGVNKRRPTWSTLQETNISPKNGILKMIFLFPR